MYINVYLQLVSSTHQPMETTLDVTQLLPDHQTTAPKPATLQTTDQEEGSRRPSDQQSSLQPDLKQEVTSPQGQGSQLPDLPEGTTGQADSEQVSDLVAF